MALVLYYDLCSGVENEGSRGGERLVLQQAHLGKENSAIRRLASSRLRVPGVQNSSCFEWSGVSGQQASKRVREYADLFLFGAILIDEHCTIAVLLSSLC